MPSAPTPVLSLADRHRVPLDALIARCRADPAVAALVVIGSVARGEDSEHSDLDVVVVLADAAFARPGAAADWVQNAQELGADPDAVGAWCWPLGRLRLAAERAPEPTRFAFAGAWVPFARAPEVEALLPAIAAYPEHERADKLAAFAAQLPVHLSYLALADYSEDPYLLVDTAHELALFGGRLILAHNRLLYPGRKRFLRQLERVQDAPERVGWLLRRLLRQPSIPTATAFCDAVLGFRPWPGPAEGLQARYLHDRDEAWLWRPAALAES